MSRTFLNELLTYIKAGAGVMAIRTRDPIGTAGAVSALCAQQQRALRMWDSARGWVVGDDPIHGAPSGDMKSLDLMYCFRSILSAEASETMPEQAAYVFINAHLFINKDAPNPVMVELLTLLAHALPSTARRVIITVSPSYQFPAELQELIPILDHAPPSVEELSESAAVTFDDFAADNSRRIRKLPPEDLQLVAQAGAGMITPEFENALSRVIVTSLIDNKRLTGPDVRVAMLHEKASMVRRNRSLEVMGSVDLAQVGGLDKLKDWIKTRGPAMQPEAWEAGVSKPKGCALVGPPGTGKSLCGKVIGTVLGIATIRFDLASVFSGLVGSSEANMREALFMLESLAPCVVLLDEVDKAISVNAGGDGGTSQKVLGTLLTFMQETKAPIFWVPTLNRTENVPAEFLRTGRLDQVFGVSTPNREERLEILRIHLRARKVDPDTVKGLERIADMTDRYVGAELEGIASEARLLAYNEGKAVEYRHMAAALEGVKPLSKRMEAQFRAMETWCAENATPSSTAPDAARVPAPEPRRRSRMVDRDASDAMDATDKPKVLN